MKKFLQDRLIAQYLLITVVVGCTLQLVFYFTQKNIWLAAAMWAPTIGVIALGKIGFE